MAQWLDSNWGKASADTFCLPQERYHPEPLPPGSFLDRTLIRGGLLRGRTEGADYFRIGCGRGGGCLEDPDVCGAIGS